VKGEEKNHADVFLLGTNRNTSAFRFTIYKSGFDWMPYGVRATASNKLCALALRWPGRIGLALCGGELA
jgi:hypothetical protein